VEDLAETPLAVVLVAGPKKQRQSLYDRRLEEWRAACVKQNQAEKELHDMGITCDLHEGPFLQSRRDLFNEVEWETIMRLARDWHDGASARRELHSRKMEAP
jgi:hypothetical protein